MKELLFTADLPGIETALKTNHALASEEIALPDNPVKAHPLHRICDGVFCNNYSEETALKMAELFLQYGSDINPNYPNGKDSPLTAACSLRCDQLALLYLQHGANVKHKGCHGGTALHWSAWCGRDTLVEKLVAMDAEINLRCIEFKSTPLFWAIHGYKFGGKENQHRQTECARILLKHGADASIPNLEGYKPVQLLNADDREMIALFQ